VTPSQKLRFLPVAPALNRVALVAVAALGIGAVPAAAQEGSAEAGQSKALLCGACHGADGNSTAVDPTWPSLAGQHASYIVSQVEAFQSGERENSNMTAPMTTLTEQDTHDIAAWFASQSMAPKGADPALVERGQRIYRGGLPDRGVPACIACHGPAGLGNPLAGYPRVSHQRSAYLAKTLRDYRSGDRTSDSELNQMMRNTAEFLLDDEIEALASYMQGLH
jgi:cytochrome c553